MSSSFQLWNDSGQTSAFGGTLQLTHESDFSDNPQQGVLYFGSNNAASGAGSTKVQTVVNPGTDQVTLTPTNGLTAWATSVTQVVGDRVEPTTPNGYVYQCSTAGDTDGTTEPTWPTVVGSTVSDNTCVWTCISERHELTEIRLALTNGGLAGATPGAALDMGTIILSGSANQVEVHWQVDNAVPTVGTNAADPGILLDLNSCEEVAQ